MKQTINNKSIFQWLKHVSTSFNIYYTSKSLAERRICDITDKEEAVLKKLEKYLQIKNPEKINLYLYPSFAGKKKELGGKSTMHARFKGRKVAYVYNRKYPYVAVAHEETHILCFEWGKPTSYIENQYLISTASFYEGLAMYTQSIFFNKYFFRYLLNAKPPKGMTINQGIKPDVQDGSAPAIKDIVMYDGYCNKLKNGAQLGSIVEFLINTFGINKFKRLFVAISEKKSLKNNEKEFIRTYSKNLSDLDKEWRKYVLDN